MYSYKFLKNKNQISKTKIHRNSPKQTNLKTIAMIYLTFTPKKINKLQFCLKISFSQSHPFRT